MITFRWPVDAPLNEDNPFGANPDIYATIGYKGHPGIDFSCPVGTPVLSCEDGRVTMARNLGTAGLAVLIRHESRGGDTRYCHLSELHVEEGDYIVQGQQIGLSGATGYTFGPHLHLDLWLDAETMDNGYGGRVDPVPYLAPREGETAPEDGSGVDREHLSAALDDVWAVKVWLESSLPMTRKRRAEWSQRLLRAVIEIKAAAGIT